MTRDAIAQLAHAVAAFPMRAPLLLRLAELPEEAWEWVQLAVVHNIWPDALGGFQEASQEAIGQARATAKAALGE